MKHLLIIIVILFLFANCFRENGNESNTKVELISIDTDSIGKVESDTRIIGSVVAYANGIEICKEPFELSEVISHLNFGESISRIDLYDKNLINADNAFISEWLGCLYNNDTVWIKKQEDISTKYDIDTINNLVILNSYGFCDFGGYGCYFKTKLINKNTNKIIVEDYFNIKNTYQINESIFLFKPQGKILLYDLINDSIVYSTKGKLLVESDDKESFYFMRNRPVELVRFNYTKQIETIIYTEPTDSTFPCIAFPDNAECSNLVIEKQDSIETINITLYKNKENQKSEDDVITYDIKVDEEKKIYYRQIR